MRAATPTGPLGISSKHTLALINRGGATARDVLRFATRIKRGVLDRFGISLRPEPVFVGFDRDHDLEFLRRDQLTRITTISNMERTEKWSNVECPVS